MAYNKQVNPYGIASSELGWSGFADGGRISSPGATQVKDNPYAAYAAKMVGDIAWNAGKELTSPTYKGIDPLTGKDIYEQGWFGRSVFGSAPLPENSYYARNEKQVHDSWNKNAEAKAIAGAQAKEVARVAAAEAKAKADAANAPVVVKATAPLVHPSISAVQNNENTSQVRKDLLNTFVGDAAIDSRIRDLKGDNISNALDSVFNAPYEYLFGDAKDVATRALENDMEAWYDANSAALAAGKYGELPTYENRTAWYKKNVLKQGAK